MSAPDAGSVSPRDEADAVAGWVDGHPDDGLLHAGLDDQLAAAESAAVADHVSRCASCRARVAAAHGLIAASRRIIKKMNYVAPAVPAPTPVARAPVEAAVSARVAPASPPASTTSARLAPSSATSRAPSASPPAPTRTVAASAVTTRPAKKWSFHWARVGQIAAALVVVTAGALIWRTIGADFRANGALNTRLEDERRSRMATEAVAADPNKRTRLEPPSASTLAAFDSLVLTRRACASQCDEFALYVSNTGDVHYELRARNGQTKSLNGTTADAALKRMSALVSSLLFETQAVPISGRSICTVFNDAHVVAMQLMVARGASRALHGNSCSATPKDLLKLGAQIDSLAGSDRFQKTLQAEAAK